MRICTQFLSFVLLAVLAGCHLLNEYPYEGRVAELPGIFVYPTVRGDSPQSPVGRLSYNTSVVVTGEQDGDLLIRSGDMIGRVWRSDIVKGAEGLETFRFVLPLHGAELLARPGGPQSAILPHQERVLCIRASSWTPGWERRGWILVRSKLGEGWVRYSNLIEKEPEYYFAAVARSGLNIRAEPSLSAPIVSLVPYKGIGRAYLQLREPFLVENRTGVWTKVSFRRIEGWAFSGYLSLGLSEEAVKNQFTLQTLDFFNRLYADLEEVSPRPHSSADTPRSSVERQWSEGDYRIIIYSPRRGAQECDGGQGAVDILNTRTGRHYYFQPGDSAIARPGPLPNTILLQQSHCRCCCPAITTELLFLMPDNVLTEYHGDVDVANAGNCWTGPLSSINFGRETRVAGDQRILMMHLRYPACALDDSLGATDDEMNQILSTESLSELFVHIRFDGTAEPEIDRVFDSGIPEKYRQEWQEAESAYPNREHVAASAESRAAGLLGSED